MSAIGQPLRCPHGIPVGPEYICDACHLARIKNKTVQIRDSLKPPDAEETPEDAAARLRHKHFLQVAPHPASMHMPEEQYHREYKGRHWFHSQEIKEQAEKSLHAVYCHACQTTDGVRITATRLFVTYEDDVMQNFPCLAHCACHQCGFEEYYPMHTDPRRSIHDNAAQMTTATEIEMKRQYGMLQNQQLQQHNQAIVQQMVRDAAKRLGLPDNMIASEAESLNQMLARGAAARGVASPGRADQGMGIARGLPNELYKRLKDQEK